MSVAETGLRSLREQFQHFNAEHGRIGAVLLCEVTVPLMDGSDKTVPNSEVWHLGSDRLSPTEFPSRLRYGKRTPAQIVADIHNVDGKTEKTFAAGSVVDGCISFPTKLDDSTPDTSWLPGVFATADGRFMISQHADESEPSVWWLTGGRFELQYFVQGPPKALTAYRKLEASADKLLRSLVEPSRVIGWAAPALGLVVSKPIGPQFWTELLFWLGERSDVSQPFVTERRIPKTGSPAFHRKWSTLPQRNRHSQPIPADDVPFNWYAVLTDAAGASAFAIDVLLAALPELGRVEQSADAQPHEKVETAVPVDEETDERLETICDFISSPLRQRIIRFLWTRKHWTNVDTLRTACWDVKDVKDESILKTCRRIQNEIPDQIVFEFSPTGSRLRLQILPKR